MEAEMVKARLERAIEDADDLGRAMLGLAVWAIISRNDEEFARQAVSVAAIPDHGGRWPEIGEPEFEIGRMIRNIASPEERTFWERAVIAVIEEGEPVKLTALWALAQRRAAN